MTTVKPKTRPLAIPWAINAHGQPQGANDDSLPRGLKCACYCPHCHDRLIRRSGTKRRPHFAHYSKQPSEGCLESSVHLAYKHALVGIEGRTYVLPLTPEPTAWGSEPWRMNPTFTVAAVQIEAPIRISQGVDRIADVLLTATDGRRIAVEIAVSNPKEPEYSDQMLSVGVLAIEHHAQIRDPLARIPSPQEIIHGSQWIAEPYSGPLTEAKEARKRRDAFLKAELIFIALEKSIDRSAAIARPKPEEAFDALCAAAKALLSLGQPDERQTQMAETIAERIATGLQYTHKRGHEQQFERFNEAIPSLKPNPQAHIREIRQDRHGRWLRRDTRERVNRLALQVARLGYRQADSRPTLFRLHFRGFNAYVDFDSTEVIDMWDVDCQPGVYAFHRNEWEDPEPLAALVRRHLIDNGIEPRIYFEDHSAITDDCYTCEQIEAGEMSNLEGWRRAIDLNGEFVPMAPCPSSSPRRL